MIPVESPGPRKVLIKGGLGDAKTLRHSLTVMAGLASMALAASRSAAAKAAGKVGGRPRALSDAVRFDAEKVQADVEARNALRAHAGLPQLSGDEELRKAKRRHGTAEFERFMHSPLRAPVERKMLARVRRQMNDSNYTPTGVLSGGGWAFHAAVKGQMFRLYARLYRQAAATSHRYQ